MLNVRMIWNLFSHKKSMPFMMFVSFLAINTVLFLIIGTWTSTSSSNILTSEITVYTAKVVDQAMINLEYNLEDIQTPIIMLSNHPGVLDCLKRYQTMTDVEIIESRKSISEVIANYWLKPIISDILIIGNNGFYYNSVSNSLRWDYNFLEQPWYKNALRSESSFVNFGVHSMDYYQDQFIRTNNLTISVGLPIKDDFGNPLGSILCDINLDKLNDLLKLNTFEKSGTLFVTDKEGKILAHTDQQLVGTPFHLKGNEPIFKGKSGSLILPGPKGDQLLVYSTARITDMKLISMIPVNEIRDHSSVLRHNIIRTFLISLAVQLVIFLGISVIMSIPFSKLISTMEGISLGRMDVRKRDYTFWELNEIGRKFEELMERLNLLIRENYESKLSLKEAELSNLQSQINPHMFYNTLQLLQTEIVCGNIKESNAILLSLSELFRYAVHADSEMVPISQEIKYLRNYFQLTTKRFQGNLHVTYQIAREVYRYKIPRLLFQPIIENSIIHGFKENPENGEIRISAFLDEKGITIVVRDNGEGMRPDKVQKLMEYINNPNIRDSKVGLRNVNQRIKLKYGEEFGVNLRSEKGKYTEVELHIARLEGGRTH